MNIRSQEIWTAKRLDVNHSMVHDADGMTVIPRMITEPGTGSEHRAELIAAAPEMLRALKALHQAMDVMLAWRISTDPEFKPTQLPQWPAVVAAHAAILKAEGRS